MSTKIVYGNLASGKCNFSNITFLSELFKNELKINNVLRPDFLINLNFREVSFLYRWDRKNVVGE